MYKVEVFKNDGHKLTVSNRIAMHFCDTSEEIQNIVRIWMMGEKHTDRIFLITKIDNNG